MAKVLAAIRGNRMATEPESKRVGAKAACLDFGFLAGPKHNPLLMKPSVSRLSALAGLRLGFERSRQWEMLTNLKLKSASARRRVRRVVVVDDAGRRDHG